MWLMGRRNFNLSGILQTNRKFITMDPDLNRISHRRILYNRYFCSLDQSHIQKMLPECTISSYGKNRSCLSDL